jgi:hypothetical protein
MNKYPWLLMAEGIFMPKIRKELEKNYAVLP